MSKENDDANEAKPAAQSYGVEPEAAQLKFSGSANVVFMHTASAAQTPSERQAILDLQDTFVALEDAVLYAYANDDQPVGPRIGNPPVPETTLKALAGYELERRKTAAAKRKWLSAVVILPIAGYLLRGWLG